MEAGSWRLEVEGKRLAVFLGLRMCTHRCQSHSMFFQLVSKPRLQRKCLGPANPEQFWFCLQTRTSVVFIVSVLSTIRDVGELPLPKEEQRSYQKGRTKVSNTQIDWCQIGQMNQFYMYCESFVGRQILSQIAPYE